jgi:hypothetical protein
VTRRRSDIYENGRRVDSFSSRGSRLTIEEFVGKLPVDDERLTLKPHPQKVRANYYKCRCECGNVTIQPDFLIRQGKPASCGCSRFAKDPALSPVKTVFATYKWNSEKRGLLFDLDFDAFHGLCEQACHYCGAEPSNKRVDKRRVNPLVWIYNGIDRFDNAVGYVPGNCVPCCWICNELKGSYSGSEFLEHIQKIASHQQSTLNTKYALIQSARS